MDTLSDNCLIVYILLLNYRCVDRTIACVESLYQSGIITSNRYNSSGSNSKQTVKLLVIDNASPDDSVAQLKNYLEKNPGCFVLLPSEQNNGYSAGNNIGIRWAQTDFEALPEASTLSGLVWLLNNDTTVTETTLQALITMWETTCTKKRSNDLLVGSLLKYPDGRYQQVGTKINWWTGQSKGYPEKTIFDGMPVQTLTGASMLIPLAVFQTVGLLDESYFLYFEDAEFSERCKRHGVPLVLAKGSVVYHEESASTGKKSVLTQYYFHRNRLFFLMQYATPLQKATIGLYTVFRLIRAMLKALLSADQERRTGFLIQWIACQDAVKGIRGQCLNPTLLKMSRQTL
ncbi:MAG: glycosyltransferase family 2 protein [Cyanobacteria bacterium P01_H01_bin.74]